MSAVDEQASAESLGGERSGIALAADGASFGGVLSSSCSTLPFSATPPHGILSAQIVAHIRAKWPQHLETPLSFLPWTDA